ncbi:hypothetical protein D088_320008 [Salmonella enterica subsp. houtenae serovar 16:z4,z32:-- str. RKS3027]|nr:hypothetical protein D088_320008 [Salmonella enterica subsp. houtenae serovar 16:z4,z32:-- str. RKS3027]
MPAYKLRQFLLLTMAYCSWRVSLNTIQKGAINIGFVGFDLIF